MLVKGTTLLVSNYCQKKEQEKNKKISILGERNINRSIRQSIGKRRKEEKEQKESHFSRVPSSKTKFLNFFFQRFLQVCFYAWHGMALSPSNKYSPTHCSQEQKVPYEHPLR
jgi:hypothetical protein